MKYKLFIYTTLILAIVAGTAPLYRTVAAQAGYSGEELDLSSAQRVLDAALAKAAEQDTKMNVTILDAGGHLKAFARMDGAYLGSIDVSMRKAKTSILFQMPSGTLGSVSQPGGDVWGIEHSNDGLITFAGGFPLTNSDGVVVGAIGVSGSSVANDVAVAEAGVAAL